MSLSWILGFSALGCAFYMLLDSNYLFLLYFLGEPSDYATCSFFPKTAIAPQIPVGNCLKIQQNTPNRPALCNHNPCMVGLCCMQHNNGGALCWTSFKRNWGAISHWTQSTFLIISAGFGIATIFSDNNRMNDWLSNKPAFFFPSWKNRENTGK